MRRWFTKEEERPVEVVERVIPVEIPILTETKRRLARGEYSEALRGAYLQVVEDLQRAFGTRFPAGWTTGEILERGPIADWGHLPEFLQRLTDLYTPLRFGAKPTPGDSDELVELLHSIYAARPMWRLYLEPREVDRGVALPGGNSTSADEPAAEHGGRAA